MDKQHAGQYARYQNFEAPLQGLVQLDRMAQLEEVRVRDDDWTGRTSAAERRKLQNRLHQRKHSLMAIRAGKRRKLRKAQESHGETSSGGSELGSHAEFPIRNVAEIPGYVLHKDIQLQNVDPAVATVHSRSAHFLDLSYGASTISNLTAAQVQTTISRLERIFSREYMTGSPRSDLLLTLIQFNVFRGLVGNTFALGFPFDWLKAEALSPFNIPYSCSTPYNAVCPPSLRPTQLQRVVPHHPWIDLFPFPELRDNMLRMGEDFEGEDDLCYDLVETCHAPSERSGLIVWGDAWDPDSWEVTEGFASKWAWILQGCGDLLRSTNYWRRQRGEEDLVLQSRIVEVDETDSDVKSGM